MTASSKAEAKSGPQSPHGFFTLTISAGDIFDDGKVELFFGYVWVCIFDPLRLLLRSHRGHDRVTSRKEEI